MSKVVVETQAELARCLQVRAATVTAWRKLGLPQRPDGTFDVDEVRAWRAANIHRGGDRRPPAERAAAVAAESLSLDERESMARYRNERTITQRLINARMAGELIPREFYVQALEERAVVARRMLETRRRGLAGKLANVDELTAMRILGAADDELIAEWGRMKTLPRPEGLTDEERAEMDTADAEDTPVS